MNAALDVVTDPETRRFLEQAEAARQAQGLPRMREMTLACADTLLREAFSAGSIGPVVSVGEKTAFFAAAGAWLPVRVFRPANAPAVDAPVLVFVHGGGWCIGSSEAYVPTCRYLAAAAGAVVVMPEYRLAPQYAFPTGLEDCLHALEWTCAAAPLLGVDRSRLALVGDSSGGNFVAVIAALAAHELAPTIAAQGLIYPVLDPARPSLYPSRSRYASPGAVYFSEPDVQWFWSTYRPNAAPDDPRIAPICFEPLPRLAPLSLVVAEIDPLRDEALCYARRLQAVGISADLRVFAGTVHGFASLFGILGAGREALHWLADSLNSHLRTVLRGADGG